MPSIAHSGVGRLLRARPELELAIHRLFRREPEFRAVCDDLEAVRRALEHWRAVDPPLPGRVAECLRMLQELEAEAFGFLALRQEHREPRDGWSGRPG